MLTRRLLASVLVLLFFFVAGMNKIPNVNNLAKGLVGKLPKMLKKIPMHFYVLVIVLVILIELICPVLVVYTNLVPRNETTDKINDWSLYTLIGFTILATLLYHHDDMSRVLLNATVVGGLILLLNN